MIEPTPRELEIIDLLTRPNASIRSVAHELGLSESTIKGHLGKLYRKLDVRSQSQAARIVFGAGQKYR